MCLDEIKTTGIKGLETQGKNNRVNSIFPLILPLVSFSAGEGWSVPAPPHPRAAPLHSAGGTDHRTAVVDRRQDDKL